MAKQSTVWLPVVVVDELLESVTEMLHRRQLDARRRRRLARTFECLTEARQRSNGRKVAITRHTLVLTLRCMADVSDYFEAVWREYFGN